MFICQNCRKDTGPKIKPVKTVTLTRATEYHNTRVVLDDFDVERKEKVDSFGFETAREIDLCPECAGEDIPVPKVPIKVRQLHDEVLVKPLRVSLVGCAVQSALERVSHLSERAKRDTAVAIPMIKQFTDDNPKFLF